MYNDCTTQTRLLINAVVNRNSETSLSEIKLVSWMFANKQLLFGSFAESESNQP